MKVMFNEGSRLVSSIKFPNDKISVLNTADEIAMYCKDNVYLESVEGGRITSHYGKGMFYGATKLSAFTTQLNGIMSGESMFEGCTSLSSITTDLSNLRTASEQFTFYDTKTGGGMFKNCTSLTDVQIGTLEHLSNGTMMFLSCSALKSLTGSLNSLIYGEGMFYGCTALENVELGSLNRLQFAKSMFSRTGIKSFSADTQALEGARYMFSNCSAMTSCECVLNKVSDTTGMFDGCVSLRTLSVGSVDADLNLSACPLTLKSISGIAESVPNKSHTIHVSDYTKNLTNFSKVATVFESKGWKII